MFSIKTSSAALAFVTAIAGIEALTLPLVTDCSAVGNVTVYANKRYDDIIRDKTVAGTCGVVPSNDKIVSVSTSMGNKCGSCFRVGIPGGASETMKVFDHSEFDGPGYNNETEGDTLAFQIPISAMNRIVGVDGIAVTNMTFTEVVCEDTNETVRLEFPGNEAYAIRLAGADDAITSVAVYNGGDYSSIEYLKRMNKFSSYWVLPTPYRNTAVVLAFELANMDAVFATVHTGSRNDNHNIEVQLQNKEGEVPVYTPGCTSENFEDSIHKFLNRTDDPLSDIKDPEDNSATGLMATSFAASTVFAVVSLLF